MRRFKWIEWNLQKIAAHEVSAEEVEAAFDRIIRLDERRHRLLRGSHADAAIRAAARQLGCAKVHSEDLNDGQDYDGVRVENPFRGVVSAPQL